MGGRLSGKTRERRSLERVAHHEAGHAVAAIHHDIAFRYVTIRPDPATETLGHILHRPFPKGFQPDVEVTPRMRDLMERHIVALFAGGLSEKRFAGRHNYRGSRSDHEQVIDLATYVSQGYGRTLDRYVAWPPPRGESKIRANRTIGKSPPEEGR